MNKTTPYSYSVLRYVHDITTGEFINVGVAIYAPEARFASAMCRNTIGRLSKVFPGIKTAHFRSLMRHIQDCFDQLGERLSSELPLEPADSVVTLAHRILPADDSSLQWSPPGAGRAENPAEVLEKLYERFVMLYDDRATHQRRTEDDVWRQFKKTLQSNQLMRYFEPARITVQDDEIEFRYAWQNGVLHCLEPISFDLSSRDSIRDKAHRWLGRATSIKDSNEKFRLYFLVGQPQEAELKEAYDSALSILRKIPVDTEIFNEQQTDDLSTLLKKEVAEHQDLTS